jgi:hypothetical protein
VRWIADSIGGSGRPTISAVWSPDGSRVLLDASFSAALVDGPGGRYRVELGALLVYARTTASRVVLLRSVLTAPPAGMGKVVFGPDGKGFAVAMTWARARHPGTASSSGSTSAAWSEPADEEPVERLT